MSSDGYTLSGLFLEDNNPITFKFTPGTQVGFAFKWNLETCGWQFERCLILNVCVLFAFVSEPFTVLQVSLKNFADGVNRKQTNI